MEENDINNLNDENSRITSQQSYSNPTGIVRNRMKVTFESVKFAGNGLERVGFGQSRIGRPLAPSNFESTEDTSLPEENDGNTKETEGTVDNNSNELNSQNNRKPPRLASVDENGNPLRGRKVKKNPKLSSVDGNGNVLRGRKVGKNPRLASVDGNGNILKGRKIRKNPKLGTTDLSKNNITDFIGLKYKIIIMIIFISIIIIILFMFMIMVIELDGDDIDGDTLSSNYDEITMNTNGNNNEDLWYPVGSSDVTTSIDIDGNTIIFRSGTPVPVEVKSSYGYRGTSFHNGIDISAGGDVYLIAMADGEITYISDNRDYGSYNTYPDELPDGTLYCSDHAGMIKIDIKYNNGFESQYLHLEEKSIPSYLKVGSKVYQGQVIGKMGNTGCSTGQHLHYSLLLNNQTVNPDNFVTSSNPRNLLEGLTKRSEDVLKDSISGENLEGKDNKQKVCFALKNYYSDNVVAGIMVNVEKESTFDPTNCFMEYDGYPSCGLFQWHLGRLTLLKSMYGDEWTLLSNQIEYFRYEIDNTESKTKPILNNTSLSVSEVAYQFCKTFERAKDCSPRKNLTIANNYENYVKNGCK